MTRPALALVLLLGATSALDAQVLRSYGMASPAFQSLPPSNSINDILVAGGTIWIATESGLARVVSGGTAWQSFGNAPPFDGKGVSAIGALDSIVCAATAYSRNIGDGSIPAGGGFYLSTDRGMSWTFRPQSTDTGLVDTIRTYGATGIRTLAITTDANNITYDIALTHGSVWTANFAGMLRRSTNGGLSWERVVLPPDEGADSISATDTLHFDLSPTSGNAGLVGNYNHRVFSVIAASDSVLWVGTAGGINRTTDGGRSWRKFTHTNQSHPISGNFVVAIRDHRWGSRHVVWAATINANDAAEQKGVSFTEDGGETWRTVLLGEWAHNLAVHDSVVYAATDNGLFRSGDFGISWQQSGSIIDHLSGQRFSRASVYAVASAADTIWVGGPDGIAYTIDSPAEPFGAHWHVFRSYQPLASGSKTYSYPCPFSPNSGIVRLHYRVDGGNSGGLRSVTIRIFDFAMMPVRMLLHDAPRNALSDHDDIWDGRTDSGARVANGVYFYRVEADGQEPAWGKIMVLQ